MPSLAKTAARALTPQALSALRLAQQHLSKVAPGLEVSAGLDSDTSKFTVRFRRTTPTKQHLAPFTVNCEGSDDLIKFLGQLPQMTQAAVAFN